MDDGQRSAARRPRRRRPEEGSNPRPRLWIWAALGFVILILGVPTVLALANKSNPQVERGARLYAELANQGKPQVERGAQLYGANCQRCHGGATAVQMVGIAPPHNANGHTWHHSDCDFKTFVLIGFSETEEMRRQEMGIPKEAPRMPSFKDALSEQDVDAIMGYIKTWWTPEQREVQAKVTMDQC